MRLLKPQTLRSDMWEYVKRKECELQGIKKDRECIRKRMTFMAFVSGHGSAMAEASNQLENLSKDFIRREQKLKAIPLDKRREEWLRRRSSSILLGRLEIQGHKHLMIDNFLSSRITVIEVS